VVAYGICGTAPQGRLILRYEPAWHLAKLADEASLTALLADADENMNLAGLIRDRRRLL